ncbi:uncharacterized protein SAPINGB_P002602 [Magnusiomyces paraingens]|uniref:DUF962 domain-containing protein n=1 Tax=Magnusiomyces paraingens TaxID=2606893 RepID=A0A5E8BES7_9ASCO|nr:uncharacterized protein SAPINGB_P002602 [Saprochaete ingens]VVT50103.1 unnamed protein product [Saprochaete ingens]
MGILDLEEQLAFYRKYHYNSTNVAIHIIFVPTILFSSLAILSAFPLWPTLSSISASYLNIGLLTALSYGLFYLLLDLTFGLPTLFILLAITRAQASLIWLEELPFYVPGFLLPNLLIDSPIKISIILFVVGWIVQFIGHGVYEKRAPALLDNLVQALVLAPFFVLFEIAYLLGFRTQVIERVDEKILPEIKAFHKIK